MVLAATGGMKSRTYSARAMRSASGRPVGFSEGRLFIVTWLTMEYASAAGVDPPTLSRVPTGVTPWQLAHLATQIGAPGRGFGVTFTVPDAALVPSALVAVTEQA